MRWTLGLPLVALAACIGVQRPAPVAEAPAPVAEAPSPMEARPAPVESITAPQPPSASVPPRTVPSAPPKAVTSVPPAAAPKAAAPAPPPAAPALDLAALEKRLRETRAIGTFTKLAVKNDVDDLLDRFRALHAGRTPPTLAELRQNFNLLLMKILALLQDGDPELANAIARSREAIWGVLADKSKIPST